jgi:hypothetical protein
LNHQDGVHQTRTVLCAPESRPAAPIAAKVAQSTWSDAFSTIGSKSTPEASRRKPCRESSLFFFPPI